MLNFSPEKILIVLIIALVVLGPNRLPQAARTLGRVVAEVRKVSGSFQNEVRDALVEPRDALSNVVGDLGLGSLRQSVRDSVTGVFDPSPGSAGASPTAAPSASTAPGASAPADDRSGAATDPAGSPSGTGPPAGATVRVPASPDDPSYN